MEEDQEETEDYPEMEKRDDPSHPYCTNWPVSKRKYEKIQRNEQETL